MKFFYEIKKIIKNAKVPIIKARDLKTNIEFDICVNNKLGTINTQLLKMYSKSDKRVSILGNLTKFFIKKCKISGGDRQLLSSYAAINLL